MAIKRVTYEQSPIATWLDYDLPRLVMQNAKESRRESQRQKEKKDNIAASRVEEAIKTLNPNSSVEEFSQVKNTIDGFKSLYDNDNVMSEWNNVFDDMFTHKSLRAEQNAVIQKSLDSSLNEVNSKIKDLDKTKNTETLVDDIQKLYSENLHLLTDGEQSYYKNKLSELDNAKTIASLFIDENIQGNTNPDNPFEAESIKANNPEYQTTWDSAYEAFIAGDYTSSRNFINEAKKTKASSDNLYHQVSGALSIYFDKNDDGTFKDVVKDEWLDEVMPMDSGYGTTVYTNVDLMVGSARSLYESGDLRGALSAIRKLPTSIGRARKQQAAFLLNEMKDQSDIVDAGLKTVTENVDLMEDADDEVKAVFENIGSGFDKKKGQNIGVNKITKDQLVDAIAQLTDLGESGLFDPTEGLLDVELSNYLSDRTLSNAESLSDFLVENKHLVDDMDFAGGGGSDLEAQKRMKTLLDAYETVNDLLTQQQNLVDKYKHDAITQAASP